MKMFPNVIYEDELKNKDDIKNKGEPNKEFDPKIQENTILRKGPAQANFPLCVLRSPMHNGPNDRVKRKKNVDSHLH